MQSKLTEFLRKVLVLSLFYLAISPTLSIAQFQAVRLVGGLSGPTAMAFSPDGRIFVVEKNGVMKVIKNGQVLSTPFLSVSVQSDGERGLLGVTVDPNFSVNRYVYIYYTNGLTVRNRVSRFRASASNPDVAESGSETVILDNISGQYANHNGGAIHFGNDGKLYIAVGDNLVRNNSQALNSLSGKILRINSDGSIPSDNPYVGVSGSRAEIWASGFRNPFTFAVDPGSNRIYVNDVGENTWEEINSLTRGGNYGWPTCEGSCNNSGFVNPLHSYGRSVGQAITGAAFYRGSVLPSSFAGDFFFGDVSAGTIRRLDSNNQPQGVLTGQNSPIDISVGPDGTLYFLSVYSGQIFRINYIGSGGNRSPTAVISANPTSGAAPLPVSFSAAGSSDPDGDALTYVWNFGDGSPNVSGSNVSKTYSSVGNFTATVTVTDGRGGTGTATRTISVGNTPPVGEILTPGVNSLYSGGDTISYSGTASDAQDGELAAGRFSWEVRFYHDTHWHPFVGPIQGSKTGSFVVPRLGEVSTNVYYKIILTVTDSGGQIHVSERNIVPRTVNLSVQTSPSGIPILFDDQPKLSPYSTGSVVGISRGIGVVSPQNYNGGIYEFVSWSNGGAQNQVVNAPSVDTTYVATFRLRSTPTPTPTATPTTTPTPTATPSPTPTPGIRCDLNGTGGVGVSDVQICVNQIIGTAPCTNGDVDGNRQCNVVDLQKVVNGALGEVCP